MFKNEDRCYRYNILFLIIIFWGLGIGDWGLGPIPNPQSPIPNLYINIEK